MEQSMIIRYRWTADELLTASRCHARQTTRWTFGLAVFIPVVLVVAKSSSQRRFGIPEALGIAFGLTLCFLASRALMGWQTRRRFRHRPDRDKDQEWEIYPDKLICRNGLGQSEFKWEALAKVVRSSKGYLFYPTDQIFYWLPRHGFQDQAAFERLANLARDRVKKYREVT